MNSVSSRVSVECGFAPSNEYSDARRPTRNASVQPTWLVAGAAAMAAEPVFYMSGCISFGLALFLGLGAAVSMTLGYFEDRGLPGLDGRLRDVQILSAPIIRR